MRGSLQGWDGWAFQLKHLCITLETRLSLALFEWHQPKTKAIVSPIAGAL
jgi:hypothetical protein